MNTYKDYFFSTGIQINFLVPLQHQLNLAFNKGQSGGKDSHFGGSSKQKTGWALINFRLQLGVLTNQGRDKRMVILYRCKYYIHINSLFGTEYSII